VSRNRPPNSGSISEPGHALFEQVEAHGFASWRHSALPDAVRAVFLHLQAHTPNRCACRCRNRLSPHSGSRPETCRSIGSTNYDPSRTGELFPTRPPFSPTRHSGRPGIRGAPRNPATPVRIHSPA
jgi:hypothetical protein